MAGDWIKIESVTPDKPEVVAMAATLGIDQDAVFGKLIRIWIWADQQSLNGHALSVTETFIDRLVCHAGFASVMRKHGWLEGENGSISLPNFERHNGETAKARALAAKRQHAKRSRAQRDKSVTREEKRREENKDNTPLPPSGGNGSPRRFIPPSLEDVRAYCTERGNHVDAQVWFDHYTSNGWKVGRNPMRDWKAAVRTWEKNGVSTAPARASPRSNIPDAEMTRRILDGGGR